MSPEAESSKKVYCNHCQCETNHVLKGAHSSRGFDEELWFWEEVRYSLWICAGCDCGTMEEVVSVATPIERDDEPELSVLNSYFYPQRTSRTLRHKHFRKLDGKMSKIYAEVIDCFNIGAMTMCTAGLRVLLEGVCEHQGIKGTNLKERTDNLEFVMPNKNIVENLHHFRITGNQALHDGETPDEETTRLAVEVMEDLLNYFYELEYKSSMLKSDKRTGGTPPSHTTVHTIALTPAKAEVSSQDQT
jgi:hypothetical protein